MGKCTAAVKDHLQTAAAVLHSMQLSRYQVIDLEYSFVDDFHHRLIRESLISARFSDVEMGVGLRVGRLICKYIQQVHVSVDQTA